MIEQASRHPVDFHSGVIDKLSYVQRLLSKASSTGQRVAVIAPEAELRALSTAMWQSEATGFSGHATPSALPHVRDASWCWLMLPHQVTEALQAAPLVIHAGGAQPESLVCAQRLIEVVGTNDEERQAARGRWRVYEAQGCELRHYQR